jgi:hypothetical protein
MSNHENDNDEVLTLLDELTILVWSMIVGIFRFVFVRLPMLVYELFKGFFDRIGRALRYLLRVAVGLVRVAFVILVWLGIVLGPIAAAFYLDRPYSSSERQLGSGVGLNQYLRSLTAVHFGALAWTAVGLAGSIWGFSRWWQQRRLRQTHYEAGSEQQNGGCLAIGLLGTLLIASGFLVWGLLGIR